MLSARFAANLRLIFFRAMVLIFFGGKVGLPGDFGLPGSESGAGASLFGDTGSSSNEAIPGGAVAAHSS
jgi:hypothetical protein